MEQLKQLFSSSFLDLERAEARVLHILEILTATCRERDDAREQLLKLVAEYCNTITNTQQPVVVSSDRSEWPDTMLAGAELNVLNPYPTMNYDSSSHSPPLVGLPDQFLWNSTPVHHFDRGSPDVELQRSLTSYSNAHCSNLMDLKSPPLCHQNVQQVSLVERQESEQQQQIESHFPASPPYVLGCNPAAIPTHLPEPPKADLEVIQATLPDVDLHRHPTSSSNVHGSTLMELNDQPFCHQNEQQLSLAEQQESEQERQFESHLLVSPPSILGCNSAAGNLPEPPEADVEVSQGALPERGKLLQAVMQAGPLLQTLLLTGRLPQWRNPPPALDCVEIPRISMWSSSSSTPSVSPLVQYVPTPHGPAGPLEVNSGVTSSHHRLRPRTRINKPPIAAVSTSQQLAGSVGASRSSKTLFAPVLNSMDSANARWPTLKFAKMQ